MTAEVGVLNRLAVALAADSAVTLGKGEKIYTSADKLFQLAENAPIGIMVYGAADYMDVPWETLIKIYRRHIGDRVFGTVTEYAADLLNFLARQRKLFPEAAQTGFVSGFAEAVFQALLDETYQRLQTAHKNPVTEGDLRDEFANVLKTHLARARSSKELHDLPDNFRATLRAKYGRVLSRIKKKVLQQFPVTLATSRNLSGLVLECLTRRGFVNPLSGVVIAGFGEAEHYPALVELELCGMAANRPLVFRKANVAVGRNAMWATVAPFAQHEMVETFMEGIDPSLRRFIASSTEHLLDGVARAIVDNIKNSDAALGSALDKHLKGSLPAAFKDFNSRVDQEVHEKYSQPVMSIVAALPKDELAAIAESLVNLTKFKRRVSTQQETVGGPVDVAVITKGDGFVWVRRKHYFQQELNQRFVARYYRRD